MNHVCFFRQISAGLLLLSACGQGPAWAAVRPRPVVVHGQGFGPRAAAAAVAARLVNPDPRKYMFENQIKPGMRGYGLTVMHGVAIQKFHFQVLDVVRNFGPDMNVIVVRCQGLGLRHSGVIEGMSGSPLYIDGRMIGAIAYGWNFSKNPIAGVQPIRQMLAIPLPKAGQRGRPPPAAAGLSWVEHSALAHAWPGWSTLTQNLFPRPGGRLRPVYDAAFRRHFTSVADGPKLFGLQPLSSPLEVGGGSPAVLRYLRDGLRGSDLNPVAAGAAGAPSGWLGGMKTLTLQAFRLEPGAAIGVPLLTGDMNVGAIGTVTNVVNHTIWAFGHRFFAEGPTALPISGAYIYTVVPSLSASFKLGSTVALQGRLIMDQETGIVGTLGAAPPAVPIAIQVAYHHPAWRRDFHYQLYPNPHSTMMALGAALIGSLDSQRKVIGHHGNYTVRIHGMAALGRIHLPIDELATTGFFQPNQVLLPVALLLHNPFGNLHLSRVNLHVSLHQHSDAGLITSIVLQHHIVAPGHRLTCRVALKRYRGRTHLVTVSLQVPRNTPPGNYRLMVGSADAALLQETWYFPQRFAPDNLSSLVRDIRHILSYRQNRIYARLIANAHGVATANAGQPNLPASRIDLLTRNPAQPLYPLFNSVLVSVPAGAVVEQGGQDFEILVRHRIHQRFFAQPPAAHDPSIPAAFGAPGGP